jgi:hypothetical protein
MFRSTLLRLTGLLVVCHFGVAAQPGTLVGKAADPTGNFLPYPKVRINDQFNNEGRRYETTGDRKGQFGLDGVEPGIYAVTISVQGFRDKTVPNVRVAAEEQTDVGTLRLDLASCDAPGVICDDFGLSVYKDPIHAQGAIQIPQLFAVDIDEGKSTCTIELDGRGTVPPNQDADSDFWVRPGRAGELYLSPRNGAGFALNPPAEWSKMGCITACYSTRDVRIDGLPLGSRVCIRTNRGRYAQVAFSEVVKSRAERIKVEFITWQGKPDWPPLQGVPDK